MNFLEERILKDGIVKPGNVLKVDSFLNHQMDIALLDEICTAFGGTVDIDWNTSAPPVINDTKLAERFLASAKKVAGENTAVTPSRMGSEDFAWYLTKVPGIATRLGTGNAEKGANTSGHTNVYRIDEDAFENGILGLCQFVLDFEER